MVDEHALHLNNLNDINLTLEERIGELESAIKERNKEL